MRTLFLAALVLLAPARPTSRFVVQCQPAPSLSCTVASTSLSVGAKASYHWSWGDGRAETHVSSTATNAWARAGTYTITLTVTDSTGASSTWAQQVAVPAQPTSIVHDTITLPAPPPIVIHDTVQLPGGVIHDTVSTALPILPPGITIGDPNGERNVYFNNQFIGRLMIDSQGGVVAYRYNPTPLPGQYGLKAQATYPTQVQAIAGLLAPPPVGWVP